MSAMTLLEARDGEGSSYIEIAEAVEEYSPTAGIDLTELWRRAVFGILITNTDDHLRNHGFLRRTSAGSAASPLRSISNPDPRRREFDHPSGARRATRSSARWTSRRSSASRARGRRTCLKCLARRRRVARDGETDRHLRRLDRGAWRPR